MFDHVKFGVSDYAASKAFFLKALEPLGVVIIGEDGRASLKDMESGEQQETQLDNVIPTILRASRLSCGITAPNRNAPNTAWTPIASVASAESSTATSVVANTPAGTGPSS